MGALHRFEQRLEHMVSGAFARAFRSAVQPVEIAAALQREVDNSAQILSRDRRLAPNDFTIDLSAADYDRLSTYGQSLVSELASMMYAYADEQHYMFAGPLHMNFHRAEDLTTGRFRVRSAAAAEVTPGPGHHPPATDTGIQRAPMVLEIAGVRHPLEEPGVVVGRGSNAGLRIDDPGVSRRHAEFRVAQGSDGAHLSVVDLGSTNGTTVDGQRVQHAVLHDGAVVQIASTTIVVRVSERPQSGPSGHGPSGHGPSGHGPSGHGASRAAATADEYLPQAYPPSYQPPSDFLRQPPDDQPNQRPRGA